MAGQVLRETYALDSPEIMAAAIELSGIGHSAFKNLVLSDCQTPSQSKNGCKTLNNKFQHKPHYENQS